MSAIRSRLSLAVFLLFVLVGAAHAGDDGARPAGPRVFADLVYAEVGAVELRLDLYLPAPAAAAPPLVVWIHGGGWRRGSKANCPIRWLVDEGFAVASVQYRLSDAARFPAQIHDVKGAVRWLRAHAGIYGYAAERVGVAGSSAGGHLAALLGTSDGVAALEGTVGGNAEVSSRVQAVYDLYGPADLTAMPGGGRRRAGGAVAALLGGAPEEKPSLARLASPLHHVTARAPPFLIAHGTGDPLVPIAQGRRLHEALRGAGVSSTFLPLEGAGHGGPAFQAAEVRRQVQAFFEDHLAASSPSTADGDVTAWARPGPYAVRARPLLVLHDAARDEDLQVRITWPEDDGLHPVIVFSHGAFGTKDGYAPLVEHWASRGYVVIQANHADSRVFGIRPLEDLFRDEHASRPADVRFLLDHLDDVHAAMEGYAGRLDRDRIGVGGHSFGAHTAQLLGGVRTHEAGAEGDVSHADPRPRAFLLVSPQGRGGELGPDAWRELERPFCVITGTRDGGRGGQPFLWRMDPYRLAPARTKYFVLVLDARHGFGGIHGARRSPVAGPSVPAQVDLVRAASLLFWEAHLRGREEAVAALRRPELAVARGAHARVLFP